DPRLSRRLERPLQRALPQVRVHEHGRARDQVPGPNPPLQPLGARGLAGLGPAGREDRVDAGAEVHLLPGAGEKRARVSAEGAAIAARERGRVGEQPTVTIAEAELAGGITLDRVAGLMEEQVVAAAEKDQVLAAGLAPMR